MTDRQHRMAGLHWHTGAGDASGLQPWLASDAYTTLAASTLCAWDAATVQTWPESLQQCWAAAGSRSMTAESLTRSDNPQPEPWPAQTEWCVGRWYTQPPTKPTAAQAASRNTALRLLQLVSNDADTHEIEDVFRHDATLSYQLLRIVNSLTMGGPRQITSFGQAILMMGRQPLRRWVNLLLFAARTDDARSSMLMAHVVLRARGMELLASEAGLDRAGQDQAFMAGMFSMLGVLFGQPLEDVLRPLKLSESMLDALFQHRGEVGALLRAWEAAENADGPALAQALARWNITPSTYNTLLVQACQWMLSITSESPRS